MHSIQVHKPSIHHGVKKNKAHEPQDDSNDGDCVELGAYPFQVVFGFPDQASAQTGS